MYRHGEKAKKKRFGVDPEKIKREKRKPVRAFSIEETQHADEN